jgi:NADH:ubiquinone oxidoreductase subunit 2 (subunit N)
VGVFAALALAGRRGAEAVSFDDLAGYARRHPAAGFALAFFLLSLTGIPPTVGFFAKFYVVKAGDARRGLHHAGHHRDAQQRGVDAPTTTSACW